MALTTLLSILLSFEQVIRSNLEPLINTLFEEDEFFLRDFEGEGLDRILFIRKMGVYVEVSCVVSTLLPAKRRFLASDELITSNYHRIMITKLIFWSVNPSSERMEELWLISGIHRDSLSLVALSRHKP